MIMSESDKEFEEYWARYYCNDNPNLSNDHPKGDCKYLWDYLYPYKKRCEELESDHKILDEFGIINLAKKCESLESQIKELEEINNMHQLARNKD